MATSTLTLEIERAEAGSRAVRAWVPLTDFAARARLLETHIQEALGGPARIKALVRDVIAAEPKDGTILAYLNQQRKALIECFRFTLDDLQTTRDLAWQSERLGYSVPSLPLLEKTLAEVKLLEEYTLRDWAEFDLNAKADPDGAIPLEEAFREREAKLSPELRRELQSRLEAQRQSGDPEVGAVG
jgi:hypothetical protein